MKKEIEGAGTRRSGHRKCPLTRVGDSVKKIVVVRDNIILWHDENGILYVGIERLLLDEAAMEW